MKKALLVLLLALMVAAAGFLLPYYSATRIPNSLLRTDGGEMEWLRKEFKLTDQQYQRIQKLHADYQPTCCRLCAQVSAANLHLQEITRQNQSMTPEVAAALKECMRVQEECRTAMLGHIYAVSAQMPVESRGRYVQLMLSHLIQPPIMKQASQPSQLATATAASDSPDAGHHENCPPPATPAPPSPPPKK